MSDETPEKVFVWKFRLDDMSLEEIGKMNQRRAELIRVFDPSIFEIVDVVEAGKTISYSICRKQHSEFGSAETIMLDAEFEVSGSYQHFPKQTIQIVDAREPKLLVARFEDPIANLECFSLKPEIKSLWKLNRRDLLCMLGSPNAPFVSGLCVDNSSNSERTDFGVFLNYADIMGMYYKGEKSGKDINKTAFKTMFLVLDVETARVLQRVPLGSGEPFCDPLNRSFRGEWLYLHPVVPSFPYEWPPSRFCQRVVNLRTGEIFDNAGDDVSAIPEYFAINDDGTAFRCDGQVIYRVDCKRVFVEEEIFRLEAPAQ